MSLLTRRKKLKLNSRFTIMILLYCLGGRQTGRRKSHLGHSTDTTRNSKNTLIEKEVRTDKKWKQEFATSRLKGKNYVKKLRLTKQDLRGNTIGISDTSEIFSRSNLSTESIKNSKLSCKGSKKFSDESNSYII
jgi:hypothetical protein